MSAATIATVMVPIAEFSYILAKQGVDTGALRESIYPCNPYCVTWNDVLDSFVIKGHANDSRPRSTIPIGFLNSVYYSGAFFRKMFSNDKKLRIQLFKIY